MFLTVKPAASAADRWPIRSSPSLARCGGAPPARLVCMAGMCASVCVREPVCILTTDSRPFRFNGWPAPTARNEPLPAPRA